MSMLDKIKGMLKGHEDVADKGIDKGGDYVDEKTQGTYQSQVDTAQRKLKDELGSQERDTPPHP
ncbi:MULTISPECIES: antitoxin [unclassified Streptomyces]|uniref:antitoxin n=1 Tax=unclassified Streptomyces TaxID=2593676 RepID=UPI0011ADE0FC|nr:antitoxin [Streptomyces sp. BK340]TVZ96239.1 antitoxin protein of toxin-antitoxin system [Streptomyces sp. BK340]